MNELKLHPNKIMNKILNWDFKIFLRIYNKEVKIGKLLKLLSIFGSGCSPGIESKLINPPSEYTDIFLSHIPPLGKLDLAVRFGIGHIGLCPLKYIYDLRKSINLFSFEISFLKWGATLLPSLSICTDSYLFPILIQ